MAEVKSTTIVPIAFYCFVLALYFLSLAGNALFGSHGVLSSNSLLGWIPVIAYGIFTIGLVAIGMGILNTNNLCWKILFFSLAISISSVASFVIVFLVFLILGTNILYSMVQINQISSVTWFCSLSVFLSGIIVLYYLSRDEVVTSFGGMGDLISPF